VEERETDRIGNGLRATLEQQQGHLLFASRDRDQQRRVSPLTREGEREKERETEKREREKRERDSERE
jgi:hypothetical protein